MCFERIYKAETPHYGSNSVLLSENVFFENNFLILFL